MARLRRVIILTCALAVFACAQRVVELEEFSRRKPPSMVPAIAGQQVTVRATVACEPVVLWNEWLLPVRNSRGAAVSILGERSLLEQFHAGDVVEATGLAHHRAGLPVVRVQTVVKQGHTNAPGVSRIEFSDVFRESNLNRCVTLEAPVLYTANNNGGEVVAVGSPAQALRVFFPVLSPDGPRLSRFSPGELIRITGVTSQYSPTPPHEGGHEITVRHPQDIQRVARSLPVRLELITWAVLILIAAGMAWLWRERKLSAQRRVLRGIMTLSEDVLDGSSPADILRRLEKQAPGIVDAGQVHLYLFRRLDHTLQPVSAQDGQPDAGVSIDEPLGSLRGAVALCFRNRTLLRIPDTARSPIVNRGPDVPPALVMVPLFAQQELAGVLCVHLRTRVRRNSPDYDVALQHLGNQIAASLRLQDQRQMREQLLRSEKMAAAGQLISGIATELRAPLDSIGQTARSLRDTGDEGLRHIAREAERGLEIVDHLLSFARMEHRDASPLNLHEIVTDLVELRAPERDRKGIRCESAVPVEPAVVLADRSQMEQAILTILMYAEHSAAQSLDGVMRLNSRVARRRVCITITTGGSLPDTGRSASDDALGLPVAQVIVQSHGGDVRVITEARGATRYEIDLPIREATIEDPDTTRGHRGVRTLTCLLIHPDVATQRRLLTMIGARGHRAIPAANAEHAAELVQRIQFDLVLCAASLSGLNWLELFHRIRRRVGVFTLLVDAWDAEAARVFERGDGRQLPMPVEDRELDDFLMSVEHKLSGQETLPLGGTS